VGVICLFPAVVAAQQSERSAQLIQEGFGLLNKKKYSKAIKALEEANKIELGGSAVAMLGLARAFNASGGEKQAEGYARRILGQSDMLEMRTWAHIELVRALGGAARSDRADIEAAVEDIRAFLQEQPTGGSSQQARRSLCQIRGGLPPENPFALSRDPVDAEGDRPLDPIRYPGQMAEPRSIYTPIPIVRAPPGPPVVGLWQIEITAIIDRDGCMRNVRNTDGSNSHQDQNIRAEIAKWVWEPAVLDDEPVSSLYKSSVNFRQN
jgi:tetratricopeptide (TPR) repeat protein